MKSNDNMIDKLCCAFAQMDSADDVKKFLDDLCTYKEVEQMAQRVCAAEMLMKGSTYSQIISDTDISSATLSRVSKCLQHGSGGYKRALFKI